MVQSLISGFFELIRFMANFFIQPLINFISNIPGLDGINNFIDGFTRILYYAFEGGIFVKRFLMVPDGLMNTFIFFITQLIEIYLVLVSIQLAIRIYNIFKGPV